MALAATVPSGMFRPTDRPTDRRGDGDDDDDDPPPAHRRLPICPGRRPAATTGTAIAAAAATATRSKW
ncbi:hypothetical protein Y032_0683g1497 [Ancylostoma ceylanicum]|nr:hypothetical protein Y032_0683g1497 [Ancylostoma ceylanicum]